MITKRPDGMSMDEYKARRAMQDLELKRKAKGRLVWLSKLHPTIKNINLANEFGSEIMSLFSKGRTYKKLKNND